MAPGKKITRLSKTKRNGWSSTKCMSTLPEILTLTMGKIKPALTTRIRMFFLALFLLAVLVGGEFALDLSADDIQNAIIIRINETRPCPSLTDLFPETIFAEEAHRRQNSDRKGGRVAIGGPITAVVTIYNLKTGEVCESRRRPLLASQTNLTTRSFRIYSLCIDCDGNSYSQYPDLIRWDTQPQFQSVSSTQRLRSLHQGTCNHTDFASYLGTMSSIVFSEGYSIPRLTIQMEKGKFLVSGTDGAQASCTGICRDARNLGAGATPAYGIGFGEHVDVVEEVADPPLPVAGTRKRTGNYGIGVRSQNVGLSFADNTNATDIEYVSGDRNNVFGIGASSVEASPAITQHSDSTPAQDRPNYCSLEFDECCNDRDCASDNNICVSRTCIDEGNPRITLTWIGDDDLDLFVVTPDGFVLSFENDVDESTGGRVGEAVEQAGPGFHVENIYFPLRGGPPGEYMYYVRPFTTVASSDRWTVTVHDEDGEVSRHEGIRYSPMFIYKRGDMPTISPAPTVAPEAAPQVPPTISPQKTATAIPTGSPVMSTSGGCNPMVDECCRTSDCTFPGEICVHRTCIDDGNPRITLKWIGDDDLDLFVETPDGAELSFMNFFDSVTGGRVGEDVDQFGFGYHVENVYFPLSGAPPGIYRFFVRPLTIVEQNDQWTVDIVDRGNTVMVQSGVGASNRFYYVREPEAPNLPIPPTRAPAPSAPPTRLPVAIPRPTPNPVVVPTNPPQTDEECSVFFDDCCGDSDCRTSRDICIQRTCIRDGNPRITLSWTGDDDLELFVRTPDGRVIDSMNTFDIFSGGRFEQDSDQAGFGRHVESVYFPILLTPIGLYEYGVRSLTERNRPDIWMVEVFEDGDLVSTNDGTGESVIFSYDREMGFDGPQRPRPSPPRCSPISDECCLDSDCGNPTEVCVQRACIDEGNPRISLTWIGDDDLDLVVETPGGAIISRQNQFDEVSGGQYGEQPVQTEFGFHVESVFFPPSGGPGGTYKYYLRTTATRGVGADVWRIRVYEGGVEVEQQIGIGDSREFLYFRVAGPPTPPAPTPPGPTPPSPTPPTVPGGCNASAECCSNVDCVAMPGELCENRNCVREGNPRFTLTWVGNDDWDLSVTTPYGDVISSENRVDRISGGEFGEEAVQTGLGFHAENVYFPMSGGPVGAYTATVRLRTRRGSPDQWTLRIYDGSVLVVSQTGATDSGPIEYARAGQVMITPAPSSGPLNPTTERPPIQLPPAGPRPCPHECCSDTDCSSGDLCIQRTCIADGTPRITLSWTGNDDLNLVIITPNGRTISFQDPLDSDSGGVFSQDSNQAQFGFHVESVNFPAVGGPAGLYSYLVQTSNTQGAEDRWTVRVYAFGQLVAWSTGSGESRTFSYEFGGIIVGPTASPVTIGPPPTMPSPTRSPSGPPPSPTPEPDCSSDSDCRVAEVCVQRTCINSGNPRFTLTWTGNDDLNLFVVTPSGSIISASNVFDGESGGAFDEPGDQNGFGFHVENIYFPLQGGPPGLYSYYVQSSTATGGPDLWEVVVVVDGNIAAVQSGAGNSPVFTFSFGGTFPTAAPAQCSTSSDCGPGEICFSGVCVEDGTQPTTSPTTFDSLCNPNLFECCTDSNCAAGLEVCVQRTCIDEGNPRFTLSWTGNDDLDLLVLTPVNTVVSATSTTDELSGGIFGESGDQFDFGRHVENIYFPLSGGPEGVYSYYVRSFLQNGVDEFWTLRVFVDGQEVSSTTGRGDSALLTYQFGGGTPPPPSSRPPSPPTLPPIPPTSAPDDDCDVVEEECCKNTDCIPGDEICVQRTCIDLGNPRFTLTWTGDDDLDLLVVTPVGTSISFVEPVDELTGGIYGEDGVQFVFDEHVENVFFPRDRAPAEGVYEYSVRSFNPRGINDRWTVSVFVRNREVATFSGTGDSITFTYDLQNDPDLETPTTSPVDTCIPSEEECCDDVSCVVGLEFCVQRSCIERGNPRFTLTWTGDDDLDLAVVTPLGSTVAVSNPEDDETGGIFGEPGDQFEFGFHVENIFFPLSGGPGGTYTFFVASFAEVGTPDMWTVNVYVDDVIVATETGTGTSDFFVFEYRPPTPPPMQGPGPTTPLPTPVPTPSPTEPPVMNQSPTTPAPVSTTPAPVPSPTPAPVEAIGCDASPTGPDECCLTDECPGMNQLCIQRTCIDEGNPRFTLTWNGNDDYDLTVRGPIGGVISFVNQFDEDSGGVFGENGVQQFPGLHVENVWFPLEGGPIGEYIISIQTFVIFDDADTWRLDVLVDGVEVESFTGTGDSGPLVYQFNQGSNLGVSAIDDCSLDNDDECCEDSDCNGVELCVQRTCINDGNPRFTLTWTGDDDLDLFVITPSGNEISYYFPVDNLANGRFTESGGQFQYGPHVESIHFLNGAPYGVYKFYVKTFNKIGTDDDWNIQVSVDGVAIDEKVGMMDSAEFEFDYQGDYSVLTTGIQSSPPGDVLGCLTSENCCIDAVDCPSPSNLCLEGNCLEGGQLTFTLFWTSEEALLKLSVITPGYQNIFKSDLTYEDVTWEAHDGEWSHVRSLALDSPNPGRYMYSITTQTEGPLFGEWKVWIHGSNGMLLKSQNGTAVGSSLYGFILEGTR